ncbi:hypothetical protein TCON_0380 [Astathelohania contejeani]|uniref:Uncharacterized protein n=1 Tax=Astathelohania contejeani TaxID=164912 RepID=A0ABQ7I222_9MICR|nr:hypothetical protein TCON_0380 [Thelohania contejeani]
MDILITNIKFFKSIIRAFSAKKYITWVVKDTNIQVMTIDTYRYFLNLDTDIYEVLSSSEGVTFTIMPSLLHNYLNLFTQNLKIEIKNNLSLSNFEDKNCKINVQIPFIRQIPPEYQHIGDTNIQFIVSRKTSLILSKFKGLVTYEIQNKTLYLRRWNEEMREEIIIPQIDIIEGTILDFTCNNSWVDIFEYLGEYIENVMFGFSEDFLSVQFLFHKFENSYLEVQIPRSLTNR